MQKTLSLRAACQTVILLLLVITGTTTAGGNTARAASGPQDPEAVVALVEDYMLAQAEIYPGKASVSVEKPRLTNQPACDDLQVYLPTGQRLRSRMNVGVRCMAPRPWTTYVQVNLSVDGFFYVANRMIQPGEMLTLDDMMAREGDVLRLSRGTIVDPSQAVGFITTQRIPSGAPIKAGALRHPESIQRGQMVRTIARGTGFIATGEGQALQSGNPGSSIQVRTSSGQIITATVIDGSTVNVPM